MFSFLIHSLNVKSHTEIANISNFQKSSLLCVKIHVEINLLGSQTWGEHDRKQMNKKIKHDNSPHARWPQTILWTINQKCSMFMKVYAQRTHQMKSVYFTLAFSLVSTYLFNIFGYF